MLTMTNCSTISVFASHIFMITSKQNEIEKNSIEVLASIERVYVLSTIGLPSRVNNFISENVYLAQNL